jgi:hypothetical protein
VLAARVAFIKYEPCCALIDGDKIKELEIIEMEKRQ